MRVVVILVQAVLLLAVGCASESEPADSRPNVVLVTIDTLRADRLGTYGYPLPTSPNIDRFALEAVVFERGIAASAHTSPSHASILTSRYTREHSIGHHTGPTRLVGATTLADHYRAAGYATAGFVGNVNLKRGSGFDRGFEVYDDELPDREANREVFERTADQTNERVLAWLDAEPGPFFLWVHYQDPHGPYTPPAEFEGRIRVPAPESEPDLPVNTSHSGLRGIPSYQAIDGRRRASEYEGLYGDEILYADRAFGKLVERIDEHASGRDAVILLTADHGEAMGEGEFYFGHSYTTHPHLAHVPFIVRAPMLEPARSDFVVSHVDVLPTLLELTGLPAATSVSGRALGPILRGEEPEFERLVYCDIGHALSAFLDDSFIEVQRIRGAWATGENRIDPALKSVWQAYAWQPGSEPRQMALAERLRAPIRDYFRSAVPMVERSPHSDDDIEALRALGYVE